MPAYYAHYIGGVENYKKLEAGVVKESIASHKGVYCFGLAGPDIFFYCIPDMLTGNHKAGSLMHEHRSGSFFQNLFEEVVKQKGEARKIAISYLAGFIGHYELDCNCHPLVYSLIDSENEQKGMGEHFEYEAAMEVYACEHYLKKDMFEMDPLRVIQMNKREKQVLARILCNAYNRTYGAGEISLLYMKQVFFFYRLVSFLIKDDFGLKERFFAPIERTVLGYVVASPLFINSNKYKVTRSDWEVFNDCMERGIREYQALMKPLEAALIDPKKKTSFFVKLGNRSYHTGESCI